ncbi:MAG TPA: HAMP domain-containing sensor histidine kinase [Alphaproteobacteria bacterium]|nr:HAMP domain-containing sensor histidine kinase [Alphaproteobacteria bacterium]
MADSPDLRDIRVNRWMLAFSDRAFERQFQDSWLKVTARVDRSWVIGGLGFLAIFTLLLVIFLPENSQEFLWIRYEIMLPLVALAQIPVFFRTRLPRALTPSYFVGSFLVFGTALFLFVFTHRDHNLVYLFEMAAIYVFCQQYSRVLFRNSIIFSLIAGGTTLTIIVMDTGLVGIPFVPVIFAIFAHAVVGIFSGYGRELFVRRDYLSMNVLKAEVARSAELAEQANAESEAKSRFLAIVGHELRTPLNAIIGYTEAIQAGILGPVENAKMRDAIVDVHGSGQHLLGVVDDVLELSNATLGTVALEESAFDPAVLISEAVHSIEGECAKKGIKLHVVDNPDLPQLLADRRLVRRMLSNLLSNAVKYTNEGGEIWLIAGAAESGPITIDIKDSGIGIAPEKLERAMEMFGQVEDDLNRRYEGIGVGLPLTKTLIELHGGSIAVDSVIGRGTNVRLTFPPERVVAAASPSDFAQPDAA